MARAEAAVPVSVLPWMVQMEVSVVAARVVANPDSAVHMGRIGMTGLIAEVAVLIAVVGSRLMLVPVMGLRSASGWRMILLSAVPVVVFVLGKRWNTDHQQCR
jgi:hypothetical protein